MFSLPLDAPPFTPLHHGDSTSTSVGEGGPRNVTGDSMPLSMRPGQSCSSGNHWEWAWYRSVNHSLQCCEAVACSLSWHGEPVCARCAVWLLGFKLSPGSWTSSVMPEHSMVQFKRTPSNCKALHGQCLYFQWKPYEYAFGKMILLMSNTLQCTCFMGTHGDLWHTYTPVSSVSQSTYRTLPSP